MLISDDNKTLITHLGQFATQGRSQEKVLLHKLCWSRGRLGAHQLGCCPRRGRLALITLGKIHYVGFAHRAELGPPGTLGAPHCCACGSSPFSRPVTPRE